MTKQNLLDLANRVEAGEWDGKAIYKALGMTVTAFMAVGYNDPNNRYSLDAAKALFDNVLASSWGEFLSSVLDKHPDLGDGNELPKFCVAETLRAKAGEV